MGNQNKARRGVKTKTQAHQPARNSKDGFSKTVKFAIALVFLVVIALAFIFAFPGQSSQPSQSYPQSVAPVFYLNPKITSGGTKASVSFDFVNASKLVFVDLKLAQKTGTLEFQGRTIPLSLYKAGEYLPLVIVSAPSGKIIAGVRVCEPCGSFSFHIVQGMYLQCDVCGTRWNVETFAGVSGGCQSYPPPAIPTSISDYIELDLSPLQAIVTA